MLYVFTTLVQTQEIVWSVWFKLDKVKNGVLQLIIKLVFELWGVHSQWETAVIGVWTQVLAIASPAIYLRTIPLSRHPNPPIYLRTILLSRHPNPPQESQKPLNQGSCMHSLAQNGWLPMRSTIYLLTSSKHNQLISSLTLLESESISSFPWYMAAYIFMAELGERGIILSCLKMVPPKLWLIFDNKWSHRFIVQLYGLGTPALLRLLRYIFCFSWSLHHLHRWFL